MTKEQIQERQMAIMNRMSEMEEKSREANNGNILFTEAESAEYRSLVDESAGLSARLRNMVSGKEAEMLKEREDLGAKLRERIKECSQKRENATTVLANKVTGDAGGDNNTYANLEAGGLIPVTIKEIIDTKVAGIELPDDLKLVMGVTGTEIIPYSTNDVVFSVEGEVTKVGEQALNFANIKALPQRITASVPVSFRAIDNAAFDIIAFITYKFQKGWAI
ncbi:MAG: phage major capsid protein, partial [Rikenellaceae bacterium]|nr:phage major capsid protein [Rikenellaceae bacterium]